MARLDRKGILDTSGRRVLPTLAISVLSILGASLGLLAKSHTLLHPELLANTNRKGGEQTGADWCRRAVGTVTVIKVTQVACILRNCTALNALSLRPGCC
jgi:hypothetical protein